jgi:uncharacterized iron-regulated membrane protein
MKNLELNQWLWKYHFIAGIISLPFVFVLSITGAIYLFNPEVVKEIVSNIQKVNTTSENAISYQQQWEIAKEKTKKNPNSLVLSNSETLSTEFIFGRFGGKKSIFINQYTGELKGEFIAKDTWMYSVRKLHGELLGGGIGTKIIELIASWMVVLIFTGLYVWWPVKNWSLKGFFLIRIQQGKRILFRDLHAVIGFWISLLLLVTLAGGLAWTDVFGANFKWVQKVTNTGYPSTWNGKGLYSNVGKVPVSLDKMVAIANDLNLKGTVSIGLPKSPKSTFSISNKTTDLDQQKMIHFDQYSGTLIKQHNWGDVGFLIRGRMWVMAFHQGEFGRWNWWIMFSLAILLSFMSFSAIISYVLRKKKGVWGIPKVSSNFKPTKKIFFLIFLLAILLPLFGLSILLIYIYDKFKN